MKPFRVARGARVAILGGCLAVLAFGVREARAVPVTFLLEPSGNQRDVNWKRLETDRFIVYHDEKAAPLARYALASIENAYPDLSLLLGVKIGGDTHMQQPFPKTWVKSTFDKIPLVLSTRSEGASFANLTNQNIEVQALRGAPASLYQHELTHRMMYDHLDPFLGPGGRAFTLAMLPTWWIEGLPEYMTESAGRLETAGIARAMARNDAYLSYDRLHALYKASGDVVVRGYVTSGRMFKYIVDKLGDGDLSTLHAQLFSKVLTPPFVTGPNWLLANRLGKWGGEIYDDFKAAEKAHWEKHLAKMPSIVSERHRKSVIQSNVAAPVVATRDHVYMSILTSAPYESAMISMDAKGNTRLPLSMEGTSHFDMHPAEAKDGAFWTARRQTFPNGTVGHHVVYQKFKGTFTGINDKALEKPVVLKLSTPDAPVLLSQYLALGDGRAFVVGNVRGETRLYAINAQKKAVSVLKTWDAPVSVSLARKVRSETAITKENCATLIVDADHEKTHMERFCSHGASEPVLAQGQLYVRDAFERPDGSHLVLTSWHDVLALAEVKAGRVRPIAPFPEWAETIRPWGETGDLGVWIFDGYGFNLHRVNLDEFEKRASLWAAGLTPDSPWTKFPGYQPYVPPYARYAAAKRAALLDAEAKSRPRTHAQADPQSGGVGADPSAPPASQTLPKAPPPQPSAPSSGDAAVAPVPFGRLEDRGIAPVSEDASYRNRHWFTYPLAAPPAFGGWSLGIYSVPFVDEMERHRVELYGMYNFSIDALSGTLSYVNNRILDGFILSAYSRERFNGIYYVYTCQDANNQLFACAQPDKVGAFEGDKRQSTLRENGASVSVRANFVPSTLSLTINAELAQIEPLYGSLSPVLGPQRTGLATLGASIAFNLFDVAFYDTKRDRLGGSYWLWSNNMSLGAEKSLGLGDARDGRGNAVPQLNFQRYNAGVSSSLSYRGHALTARSSASGTLGPQAFNYREVYQPYRTYLLGSGAGLNALNYSIAGDGSLFSLDKGFWSYRNSVDYTFPIFSDLDTHFMIAYFESLRGELLLSRGGVSKQKDFEKTDSVTSASAAMRLLIDIKGVQVLPSLAYGRLIGEDGWGLFTEISFSQFF